LGVHYPHQVVAGWLVGAILLVLFIYLDPRLEHWLASRPLSQQLAFSTGIPILIVLVYQHNDAVGSAAVMCGFGSGFALMRRYCPYSAAGLWWQRVLRTIIGLAGLLILYFGLSFITPGEEEISQSFYYALRFVRYAVLGLWISLGAPWLFTLLRPLRSEESQPELQHA
jgi:hypothetical protein